MCAHEISPKFCVYDWKCSGRIPALIGRLPSAELTFPKQNRDGASAVLTASVGFLWIDFLEPNPTRWAQTQKRRIHPFVKCIFHSKSYKISEYKSVSYSDQNSDHISLQRKRLSKGHEVGLQKAVLGELFTLCYGCVCFNDVQFSSIFENVWENIFVSDT